MSIEEQLLLQRWRDHLNKMAGTITARETMVKYALAWLRGAMMYAPIKTYSRSFVQVVIETLWVV
ncbi:hypothetical protein, partial [Phaeodactylibacter xiamenensis]|uniref:hypothetical protein n=1 Tax=Phaeodactylibacter xiamenensis TaxID=1524460 RepID=UPI0024A7EEC5